MRFNNIFLTTLVSLCALLGASQATAANAPPDIKESPNGEITVVATLEVKPGSEAAFEKAALLSIQCTRLEPGNLGFAIHKVLDAGNPTYTMHEIWRNKAALQSHFVQPYTQALFGAFQQTLSAPPVMKFVAELSPATRAKPGNTDPKSLAACR